MKKLLLALTLTATLLSCSSTGRQAKYTMDDTERPEWVKEDVGFFEQGQDIIFIGLYQTRKTANLNMNSVRKAADMKAWEQISTKIVADYQGETNFNSEGMKEEGDINESAKLVTKSLMRNVGIESRWYRVVEEEVEDQDIDVIQYFSKITIPRSKYMKQVRENSKVSKQ